MVGRIWRWLVCGGAAGVFPLFVAYALRYYYAGRPPPLSDLLASGDGFIVAVLWSASALYELTDASATARRLCGAAAVGVLVVSAVAYGCLSADSVTGRVQDVWQAGIVTKGSIAALVSGAAVGLVATVITGGTAREEHRCTPHPS